LREIFLNEAYTLDKKQEKEYTKKSPTVLGLFFCAFCIYCTPIK